MSDIYQFNVGGTTYNLANLGLLAPVQITLTADRLYNTGDQFIYTGLLYEATETIAQGTSITIGSNAQLADCVTKQISEINSNLSQMFYKTSYSVSLTTSVSYYDVPISLTADQISHIVFCYASIKDSGARVYNCFWKGDNTGLRFLANAISSMTADAEITIVFDYSN